MNFFTCFTRTRKFYYTKKLERLNEFAVLYTHHFTACSPWNESQGSVGQTWFGTYPSEQSTPYANFFKWGRAPSLLMIYFQQQFVDTTKKLMGLLWPSLINYLTPACFHSTLSLWQAAGFHPATAPPWVVSHLIVVQGCNVHLLPVSFWCLISLYHILPWCLPLLVRPRAHSRSDHHHHGPCHGVQVTLAGSDPQ